MSDIRRVGVEPSFFYEQWILFLTELQSWIPGIITRILFTVLLLFLLLLVRSLVLKVMAGRNAPPGKRNLVRSVSLYLSFFAAGLILLPLWLHSIQSFLTVIGIFGAGVLIVFKETILNTVGYLYILTRRPFNPGDRVEIDGITGDVLDIRIQDFSMLEVKKGVRGGHSTGRVVYQPNSRLFVSPVINGSKDFSFNWTELEIHITPDSDWRKALEVVENAGKKIPERIQKDDTRIRRSEDLYDIRYRELAPKVYVDMTDEAIVLTLRFLCEPRLVREVRSDVWREILDKFQAITEISPGKKC